MIRLFVAMRIPYEVRKGIFNLIEEILPDHDKYKWEHIEKIHLTLKFIGSMDEKYLSDIGNKLSFVENYNKFHFSITGFNFFFRFKNPQIMWVGLRTEGPVKGLVREIENVLTAFSVPRENRDFKAHLTLMRIKDNPGNEFIESFKSFKVPEMNFSADEIILMQSILKPTGSEYKELRVYKLK